MRPMAPAALQQSHRSARTSLGIAARKYGRVAASSESQAITRHLDPIGSDFTQFVVGNSVLIYMKHNRSSREYPKGEIRPKGVAKDAGISEEYRRNATAEAPWSGAFPERAFVAFSMRYGKNRQSVVAAQRSPDQSCRSR